ncbi:MAG TPA: sensor histidine kinase, partial [Ferruginibacter sp.]|nr:sensor histidine kinase [Ferruginibacter sp.]
YIEISKAADGQDEKNEKTVARGIDDVLKNKIKEFVFEYACHSPGSQRWYRMVVTPLEGKEYSGAVVMHVDISELRQLEQERMENKMDEQKRITQAMLKAQEKERNSIGTELHDNVNQILASSLLVLGMVKNEKMKIKKAVEFIDTGKGYINNAIEELRKLSHELAPASFDNRSLKDAFMNLLMTFNLNKQFDITLDFDDQCNTLNGEIQLNLYRIMQEQIKNIVKYSAANKIEVDVAQVNGSVNMRIFDNGKGFNVKTAKNGIGLSNIKKRTESFSGKFILNSEPGKGCEIIVAIPRGL